MPASVPRAAGRTVFGRDPGAYARARLPYPERVYEVLESRCGLRPGTAVFEIGPGTGIATRELLRRGAMPLTAVEPNRRLASYLECSLGHDRARVRILRQPFERATLPPASFDLGVAATSFHWLPERTALRRVARALRPGGWWAAWWAHHGDPHRTSAFHESLQPLYEHLEGRPTSKESARQRQARTRRGRILALESTGTFDRIRYEYIHWNVTLSTERVTALWGTFSDILILPPKQRAWFLSELARIADEQFHGSVTFPGLTPLLTARRV